MKVEKPLGMFTVMEKRGLTTLEIFQDRKEGKFLLRGAKEWDDDLQFSRYMTDFTYLDILTTDYRAVGTKTLASDFKEMAWKITLNGLNNFSEKGSTRVLSFITIAREISG